MNKDDSGTTMVESAPHYRIGVSCSHPSWMIQLLEYAIPATSATATDRHKNPDLHRGDPQLPGYYPRKRLNYNMFNP